jgi:hypothetical protein
MSPAGHRDRPGQNLKCPASRLTLTGQTTGTDGTQPYRGVPLSRCPGNRPIWETDPAAYEFEERAAIREYEAGLPRAAAERLARLDMLVADRDQAKAA